MPVHEDRWVRAGVFARIPLDTSKAGCRKTVLTRCINFGTSLGSMATYTLPKIGVSPLAKFLFLFAFLLPFLSLGTSSARAQSARAELTETEMPEPWRFLFQVLAAQKNPPDSFKVPGELETSLRILRKEFPELFRENLVAVIKTAFTTLRLSIAPTSYQDLEAQFEAQLLERFQLKKEEFSKLPKSENPTLNETYLVAELLLLAQSIELRFQRELLPDQSPSLYEKTLRQNIIYLFPKKPKKSKPAKPTPSATPFKTQTPPSKDEKKPESEITKSAKPLNESAFFENLWKKFQNFGDDFKRGSLAGWDFLTHRLKVQKLGSPTATNSTETPAVGSELKALLEVLANNKETLSEIVKDWADQTGKSSKSYKENPPQIIALYSSRLDEMYLGRDFLIHSAPLGFKKFMMVPEPQRQIPNSADHTSFEEILLKESSEAELPLLLPPSSALDFKSLGASGDSRVYFNWANQQFIGFQRHMKKTDGYPTYKVYPNSAWPKNSPEVLDYEETLNRNRLFFMGTPGLEWEDIPRGVQKALLEIKRDTKLSVLGKLQALSIFIKNLGSLGLDTDLREVFIKEVGATEGLSWQAALLQNLDGGDKGLSSPLLLNSQGFAEIFANFVRLVFRDETKILTSRVVLGYRGNRGVIDSTQTWSWSEVYVRDHGFVFFDPSPQSMDISAKTKSQAELLLKLAPLAKFIPTGLLKSLLPDGPGSGEKFQALAKALGPKFLGNFLKENPHLLDLAKDLASSLPSSGEEGTGGIDLGLDLSGLDFFSGFSSAAWTSRSSSGDNKPTPQDLRDKQRTFYEKLAAGEHTWKSFCFNPLLQKEFFSLAQEAKIHLLPREVGGIFPFANHLINTLRFRNDSLATLFEDLTLARTHMNQFRRIFFPGDIHSIGGDLEV